MDNYIDIKVVSDPEFKETVLMNALYAKLHRALGQYANGKVGVSFPNHHKTLGNCLRLHGQPQDMELIMKTNWLKGLRDYCQSSDILPVPNNAVYRQVSRRQAKSAHNRRQRSVRKGW